MHNKGAAECNLTSCGSLHDAHRSEKRSERGFSWCPGLTEGP